MCVCVSVCMCVCACVFVFLFCVGYGSRRPPNVNVFAEDPADVQFQTSVDIFLLTTVFLLVFVWVVFRVEYHCFDFLCEGNLRIISFIVGIFFFPFHERKFFFSGNVWIFCLIFVLKSELSDGRREMYGTQITFPTHQTALTAPHIRQDTSHLTHHTHIHYITQHITHTHTFRNTTHTSHTA